MVAERCYSAIGDLAKARFLHKVQKLAEKERAAMLADDPTLDPAAVSGMDSHAVRAQLAVLAKQWPVAEALLLAQGKVDEVIAMYQASHR